LPSGSSSQSRWKSRFYRRQYQREASVKTDPNQSRMTDYFEIVNKVDEVIQLQKVNECLKEKLKAMEAKFNALQPSTEEESSQSLLKRMMNQAIKQAGKKSKGIRHDDPVLEHFCLNVYILGGRRLYEVFNSNMPTVFPSPSTIHQRLLRFDLSLNEGSLNIAAVKDYLITNNAPLTVCLSEDATGVVGRVEYYAKTNSLVGFSGPLKKSGFPDQNAFIARTANDIVYQFGHYDRARYIFFLLLNKCSIV